MKTAYRNIYQVLKLNRFVTILVTITAMLSTIFSGLMVYKMYEKSMNSVLAINNDGSVIPIKLVDERENLEIEILNHLQSFHRYFYDLSPTTYESNLEKALWLGDSSVDNVYRQKKADGVYNRLLQYSLVQRVISSSSKLDLGQEPFPFKTTTVFEVNRGTVVDRYELITTGSISKLEKRHFPNNPHGLWISNYFENTLRKITEEALTE